MKIQIYPMLLLALFLSCSDTDDTAPVLARVGERRITVEDFIRRSELTVRPQHLRGNSPEIKKAILNALIAEKILAAEAERDTAVTRHKGLRNLVQGIKEQYMRERFFKDRVLDKVEVADDQIDQISARAGRRYRLAYFDVSADTDTDSLNAQIRKGRQGFEDSFRSIYGVAELNRQEIGWRDALDSQLFDQLYAQRAEPGQIIGPVFRQDGRVFFFKVEAWSNTQRLSETEQQQIRQQVSSYLRTLRATEKFDQLVRELMAGKELEFDREGLIALVNLLGPVYLEKGSQFNFMPLRDPQAEWQREVKLDSLRRRQSDVMNKKLLGIDGMQWTIADFFEQRGRHPLVFRKKRFAQKEFGEQLKLAIADLLRDYFITQQCYREGYQNNARVQHRAGIWQDYFYAVYLRDRLIQNRPDSVADLAAYLDEQVRRLHQKYQAVIDIDKKIFEETQIAEISTLALQRDVPYPMVTPAFPLMGRNGRQTDQDKVTGLQSDDGN